MTGDKILTANCPAAEMHAAAASLARSGGRDNAPRWHCPVWGMCLDDDKFCYPGPGPTLGRVCDIQYSSVHANQQQEAIYSCNPAADTLLTW